MQAIAVRRIHGTHRFLLTLVYHLPTPYSEPTLSETKQPPDPIDSNALTSEEFDVFDQVLDDMRTRDDEVPQWEFCEGFMTAVLCTRRTLALDEVLEVLLSSGDDAATIAFRDAAQRSAFETLWNKRATELRSQLMTSVQALDEEGALSPEVMDVRGAIASLPEAERAAIPASDIPSFGQVWALGFMFAVEAWPDDWELPRDKEAANFIDEALERIVALTEDDTDEPVISMLDDEGEPSVSQERANAYGEALWAVYDLFQAWQALGPKVAPVRSGVTLGRNDPCHCGSGKKFKKCHGA